MHRQVGLLSCILILLLLNCRQPARYSGAPLEKDPPDSLGIAGCRRCLVLTDQEASAIDIVDVGAEGRIVWSWRPERSNIAPEKVKWFSNPDDAKPVYDRRYLLINASGGGVALIRIADKKAVFYAYAGKNPHSSEMLPSGNIVTASSTDNRLVVFHVDTTQMPAQVYKKIIPLPFAHNVVWDHRRQVLWSAGANQLYQYQYKGDSQHPDLTRIDSLALPGEDAHDLFPVYGQDALWFTNTTGVYRIDMETMRISPAMFKTVENIKSVSSGPAGWPTIIMKPKASWWSDVVMDTDENLVFQHQGMKIYKARWFLPNTFSYPEHPGFETAK